MPDGIGSGWSIIEETKEQIEKLEGARFKLFLVSQLDSIKADAPTHRAISESRAAMADVIVDLRATIGTVEGEIG